MYDWLTDALQDSAQIVTANRRLARVLAEDFAKQQIAAGRSAWRSPAIRSWQDWLAELFAAAELSQPLPTRINAHHSRVLWERCLRREIADPLLNISMLVRQARDSWNRLHQFQVPLTECESAAQGKDQRIFASAAKSYQSILDRESWIDEAGLTEFLATLVINGHVPASKELWLAGFDRIAPDATLLLDALRETGSRVTVAPSAVPAQDAVIQAFENSDAEMRAAGAWARGVLQDSPLQSIAIVATHLEQNAERCARLIREALVPAWQTSGPQFKAAVNVSYGRKLSAYPAIAAALLVLRWLRTDIRSRDVSMLMRTQSIACRAVGGRSRLELALRRFPDRNWSPAMVLGELQGRDETEDAQDWLARVSILDKLRSDIPPREKPSNWVVLIDDALRRINWPGEASLDSTEFQLVNRWKELLNDLARLELVTPTMTLSEVLGRLQTMASETVFQPESEGSIVQVLGPLEAAGMRFDQLWIAGLSAANWPPQGRPSSLISRTVQRKYEMPDATPEDTLRYARRVLERLLGSTGHCICSYPSTDGDAEQSESGLLADGISTLETKVDDPGWHAGKLINFSATKLIAEDPVPPVLAGETLTGGASTIQRQFEEPFSAFAFGRLGIRSVPAIYTGLAANFRGNLIHDALHGLYSDLPAKRDIESWSETEIEDRVAAVLSKTFWRHERNADPVLKQLFELEQGRVGQLLQAVIAMDRQREWSVVAATEGVLDTVLNDMQLSLRVDRIDRLDDGSVVILDYKTGMPKQFLDGDGEPKDMQLVVYAIAAEDPVAGLGLVNVDSRAVSINGAGRGLTPDLDWDDALAAWTREVEVAASELKIGDIRVDRLQTDQRARTLSLLSRIREHRRDG